MIAPYISLLLKGTVTTLTAWLFAATISFIIGMCVALAGCRALANERMRRIATLYTFIVKGVPAYVQILIAYFVLPALIGINLQPFVAGVAALACCSSGFVADIIRAGIDAVPKGQWQAASVLNYSTYQTLVRIILPQAMRIILPALYGEFEQLLKSSSLLATIGIIEITRSGMNIISRELNPVPVYLAVAAIYLLLSALLLGSKKFFITKEQLC
jgi:polar amino acid transport system permease protein